jgi:hypothetical protein
VLSDLAWRFISIYLIWYRELFAYARLLQCSSSAILRESSIACVRCSFSSCNPCTPFHTDPMRPRVAETIPLLWPVFFIHSFRVSIFHSPLKRLSGRLDGLSLSRHPPAIVAQSRVGNRLPATAGTPLIGRERPSSTRDRLVRALPKSTTRLPP